MYPTLVIDLNKLKNNARELISMTSRFGIEPAFVTKVFCADKRMTQALEELPFPIFADSRLENLERIGETNKLKMLLRLPQLSRAADTVRIADISLCSERKTLEALNAAAIAHKKPHKVVLMVDVGDLREGIFYKNEDMILGTASYIASADGLELFGIGCNLTCYGAILPDEHNMSALVGVADMIERQLGFALPIVSAGNSSAIPMLLAGELPARVNNLRLGESLVLGRETAYEQDLPNMHGDAVLFRAEIIELMQKPSLPEGQSGVNAFGERLTFEDKGIRRRAIIAAGRQDVDPDGLVPLHGGVSLIGSSSDHIILDITDAEELKLGDTVDFKMTYSAVLRSFTSAYVGREYIG